jgi:hypothetical protein
MATRQSVLNDALVLQGNPRGAGPADTSSWVRRLDGGLDDTSKRLLEKHPWNFATVRWGLSAASEATLTAAGLTLVGREYAYTKPPVLRIIGVNATGDVNDNDDTGHYEDEAGYIFTDLSPCYLIGVSGAWIENFGAWPAVFAWAVATELAATHCEVSTKNGSQADRLEEAARSAFREARSWDASQKPFQAHASGRWAQAMRGRRNSRWGG